MIDPYDDNPMQHPEEQPHGPAEGADRGPQFGKLLVVLGISVILIGVIVWASIEFVT